MKPVDLAGAESAFREAMRARGLEPPRDLFADGKIHRCGTAEKPAGKDGAYDLHLDGLPAGGFENWSDGRGWENWCSRPDRQLSPTELAGHRARIEASRHEREAEEAAGYAKARDEAARIWHRASPNRPHPYLVTKGVESYGTRVLEATATLVIPLRDADDVLHSIQTVDCGGEKRFLTGGRKKGCFCVVGDLGSAGVICIAEGFATAASIHQATGHTVVVAFDCGNLLPVSLAIRAKYPNARLIVCRDDDLDVPGKPPKRDRLIAKAAEAARAVGGLLAVPSFGTNRLSGATDMNDLATALGLDAVRRCIAAAASPGPVSAIDDPSTTEARDTTHGATRGDGSRVVTAIAAAAPWPSRPAGAFYGPLGAVALTIEPLTEADPVAVLIQLLAAFGNAIGRGPRAVLGNIRQWANVFVVIVGKSSKSRKGTSWTNAREAIGSTDNEWDANCIKSGLSSGEGVIHAVRDPLIVHEPIREGGKTGRVTSYQDVEQDPGVTDKRLFIIESEFSRVLKVAGRKDSTLSAVLRDGWDSGNFGVLTKTPYKATGAHLTTVGHITQDELQRELSACDSFNGFGNRFLWVSARRSKELPFGDRSIGEAARPLTDRLRAAVQRARDRGSDFVVGLDADARNVWSSGYSLLSADRPGLVGSILGRAEAQTLRLALIYALADGEGVIRLPHLEAALAMWRYCEESARVIFGDALGDTMADEILRVLRESPSGMTRDELRNHFDRNVAAARLTQALGMLASHGLARGQRETPDCGRGRPSERWLATTAPYAVNAVNAVNGPSSGDYRVNGVNRVAPWVKTSGDPDAPHGSGGGAENRFGSSADEGDLDIAFDLGGEAAR